MLQPMAVWYHTILFQSILQLPREQSICACLDANGNGILIALKNFRRSNRKRTGGRREFLVSFRFNLADLCWFSCSSQISCIFVSMSCFCGGRGQKLKRLGDAGIRNTLDHKPLYKPCGDYRRRACRSVGTCRLGIPGRTAHLGWHALLAVQLSSSASIIIHPCLFSPTTVSREVRHSCCLVLVISWKLLIFSKPLQYIHYYPFR
ncbi:unnamed protein product [Urochloa decumbens]|uniref:Uncharacterized protein n=1 Tax=Urochloa decumbens TaxID=240449 RepID=A0ABC9A315_9POAL